MKILYELATFCGPHRKIVEALLQSDEDEPIRRLYDLLYSGKALNNTEGAILVYGKNEVKQFSALKARMLDILVKVISIQNVSSKKENIRYNRVLNSMRQNLAARIVLYKGNRNLAIDLLEAGMKGNTSDYISYNVLDQLRLLTIHYGATNYNKYKLNKSFELENQYTKILEWETKAIHFYIDLKKLQLHSFAEIGVNDKEKAKKYSHELNQIDLRSRTFNFYKFQVFVKRYEFERNFEELLRLCEEAEIEFSSIELYSVSSLMTIKQIKLWTLVQLGRFTECIKIGLPELLNNESGSTNWYSCLHYCLKAYLYSEDYEKAVSLISYCVNHSNFRKLNAELKEVAYLNLAYIHLIIDSGLAGDPKELHKRLPEFKLGRFLNTTPVFSKDKRGINVSILLMHIAFLLQRKDYNAIIDRIDSLNQYAYRYLRKDDSFRSNCMIKMVIQMTKADFNPIRTERYTADLRKQLSHVTLAGSGENIEVEIIPFEVLWDIMVKAL